MITAVPAPSRLRERLQESHGKSYDGFWVLTQDPALIDSAGSTVVRGDTLKEVRIKLEERYNTPPQCTKLTTLSSHIYLDDGRRNDKRQVTNTITKLIHPETGKHHAYQEKDRNGYDNNYVEFGALGIVSAPQLTANLDTLKMKMLAIQCGPRGLRISDSIHNSNNFKQVIPENWRLSDRERIKVVDDKFMVSRCVGDPSGILLIYNPKRVKRLKKIRQRRSSASSRNLPWIKYTCYECLTNIITEYRHVCHINPISELYGWGRYSTHGIDDCMDTIREFHRLAIALRKEGAVRRLIKPWIIRLSYHRGMLERRDNDSSFINYWFLKQLRLAGGAPKIAIARYKKTKDCTKRLKVDETADRLYADAKARHKVH